MGVSIESPSTTMTMAMAAAPWWAPWENAQHEQQQQHQEQQQEAQGQENGEMQQAILIGSSQDLRRKRAFVPEEHTQPPPASAVRKKQRAPSQPAVPPTCQVEGCSADLSGSKGYHRRHRVCEVHSKTPKNIVGGVEQRFCQQCSRFHSLGEFDEGKRSCRRRLAGHNERRRKPPHPDPFAMPTASTIPIYAGSDKPHLLDGTFLLGSNRSAWPSSSTSSHIRQNHASFNPPVAADQLQLYFQNRSKQELIALHESIADQGMYQFLKCHASSSSSTQSPPIKQQQHHHQHHLVAQQPPGVMIPGALSLLSAEPWSSSTSSSLVTIASSSSSLSKPSGSSALSSSFDATHQKQQQHSQQQQLQQSQPQQNRAPVQVVKSTMDLISSQLHRDHQQEQHHGYYHGTTTASASSSSSSDVFSFQKPHFLLSSTPLVFD